jgi:hypothetical protein
MVCAAMPLTLNCNSRAVCNLISRLSAAPGTSVSPAVPRTKSRDLQRSLSCLNHSVAVPERFLGAVNSAKLLDQFGRLLFLELQTGWGKTN